MSGAQANYLYSLEFDKRGVTVRTFMRIWEKDSFHRVAVAVSDRLSSDATLKLSVLGSVVAALGSLASLAVVSGGSHVLAGIYDDYLGSGYDCKQVPILLHQTFDELPAKGVFLRFRDCRAVLHDEVHHHGAQGSRAPRQGDVTFWFLS